MQNNSIQVKGLQKSYKQVHVLNGVDFEVEKGSIFACRKSAGDPHRGSGTRVAVR